MPVGVIQRGLSEREHSSLAVTQLARGGPRLRNRLRHAGLIDAQIAAGYAFTLRLRHGDAFLRHSYGCGTHCCHRLGARANGLLCNPRHRTSPAPRNSARAPPLAVLMSRFLV